MAYRVVETRQALRDLEGILSYIARTLDNPAAAAVFADEVEQCYDNLEQMPLMYELCRDPRLSALGYRKAVIRRYILIYRVSEAEQMVYILRFFSGRQNYADLI